MGSGSPNPDGIPGLVLWTDSDNGIVSSGSPAAVDSWADKSGLAHDLAMTGGNRPILVASDAGVGGLPSLNCSTAVGPFAHKGMKATALTWGAFTKFFVVTGHVTGAGYFDFHYTDANSGDYTYSSTNGLYCARGGTKSERNPGTDWGAYGATTFKTMRVQFDGTNVSHTLALNGVSQSLTAGSFSGDPGSGTILPDWYMGVDSSIGTSTGSKWAAILIYSRALSPAECTIVENYLRTKYQHY